MKQRTCLVATLILICLLAINSGVAVGGHGARKSVKKAILLVAFGTTARTAAWMSLYPGCAKSF